MSATAIALATPATLAAPACPPTIRRKFQLTEFGDNHNKFWQIEVWELDGSSVHLRTTWGRVGAAAQSNDKRVRMAQVERLIQEKEAKGYRELDLHTPQIAAVASPTQVAPVMPRQVRDLLQLIFTEAGERIASYLAVSVDTLSQTQIQRGRDLIDQTAQRFQRWQHGRAAVDFAAVVDSVKDYYNTIPTQLPQKLRDPGVLEAVVMHFCQDFAEQETRLDQLEAALATAAATTPSGSAAPDPYQLLGARINLLPQRDETYARIIDFLSTTSRHGYSIGVREIFEIEVPSERKAYEANTFGANLVLRLTHGTNNANVRHILHERGTGSGLRLPRSLTNGWMFGPGIYFANMASKSAQYCRGRHGQPRMLFLADVAVGDMYVAPRALGDMRVPPKGCHSVWGRANHTTSWGGAL
ncbi:MAG TPA: WGR domain-containing protein, partial [Chloroflexota bacterium]|nr:WGR domain-containing protein [Chloroflexota bacterium]